MKTSISTTAVPTTRRFAVRSPEEADEPRSRLELNALQALGALLDKRQWWTTWTKRPNLHAQWIPQLEAALVEANVKQVLAVWPPAPKDGLQKELKTLEMATKATTTVNTKKVLIETLLTHVLYPTPDEGFGEGGDFERDVLDETDESESDGEEDEEDEEEEDDDDEGEEDSDDDTALDADDNVVTFDAAVAQAKLAFSIADDRRDVDGDEDDKDDEDDSILDAHKKKNAFGQISWYVNMAMLREKLRAIAPANWAPATINGLVNAALETRADPEVVARTCSLISAVIGNGGDDESCSLEAVQTHLPEEDRDDVLTILQFHFTAIRELLKETIEDISSVLDVVIQRLALPAKEEMTASATPLRTPGPVPHTWMSDDLIPMELKTRFARQVAALEKNVPAGQKDWLPNGQVLHLVDPSLYCGVVSQTKRLPQSAAKKMYGSPLEHMHANMFAVAKTKLSGPKAKSTKLFQWLPCEVDIDEQDEGGNATILTYINNLHPATFAGLYDSIQSIFTQFVPLFETVLSSLDDQADARMAMDLYKHGGNSLACLPNLAPPGLFETSEPQFSLKGSRCQVIIKLTEIHLTPQKPEYPGGAWHNDGTDSERIIATGVYYFGSDNITASRTSFRTFVNVPHVDEDANVGAGLANGLHADQLPVQYLGGVSTLEDRCVVFPNIYQHKVEPFRLADPTKPGVCKILTFFLVDPTQNPIASTAVVPPQQQEWIDLTREPQSKRARVAATVPQQAKDLSREGLSMEEAKKNRIELLKARTFIQLQEAGNNDCMVAVRALSLE